MAAKRLLDLVVPLGSIERFMECLLIVELLFTKYIGPLLLLLLVDKFFRLVNAIYVTIAKTTRGKCILKFIQNFLSGKMDFMLCNCKWKAILWCLKQPSFH